MDDDDDDELMNDLPLISKKKAIDWVIGILEFFFSFLLSRHKFIIYNFDYIILSFGGKTKQKKSVAKKHTNKIFFFIPMKIIIMNSAESSINEWRILNFHLTFPFHFKSIRIHRTKKKHWAVFNSLGTTSILYIDSLYGKKPKNFC